MEKINELNEAYTAEIINRANVHYQETRKKEHTYRWGQALWNTANDFINERGTDHLKNALEALRGGEADCFYRDSLTPNFMEALKTLGN